MKGRKMRRFQGLQWLFFLLLTFWLVFSVVVVMSGFPFLVFAIALFSFLIMALAWAVQNGV
jgi:hypothetical protein